MTFFYPPQPTRLWPSSTFFIGQLNYDKKYDAEIKYNGWRLQIHKTKTGILIYNRHGTIIDINPKLFIDAFADIPVNSVFDGELLDRRTKDVKNVIVLWDCMFFDGRDIRKLPLYERRPFLNSFKLAPLKSSVFKTLIRNLLKKGKVYRARPHKRDIVAFYDTVVARNDALEEGIVIKNLNSVYEYSIKSKFETANWFKIRKIGDHALVKDD